MTVSEFITTSNERTLDVVTSVQQQIVDGAKAIVANVERITPDSDSLPELPSAKELLDQAYGFQSRLLKANHDFSVALTEAFSSVWSAPSTSPSARPATAKK